MIRNEKILNHKIQISKIFVLPIFALISFSMYVFLTGYRGRSRLPEIPAFIRMELSWIWIIALICIFACVLFITIKLLMAEEVYFKKNISISGKTIRVETQDYIMTFKAQRAERLKFHSSKIWSKLFFQEYYRIGIIRIRYEGDKYSFFFPIRNQVVESNLKRKLSEIHR